MHNRRNNAVFNFRALKSLNTVSVQLRSNASARVLKPIFVSSKYDLVKRHEPNERVILDLITSALCFTRKYSDQKNKFNISRLSHSTF